MDRNENGLVDFEEFLHWWMEVKVSMHYDPSYSAKTAVAANTWIPSHHPSLELPEPTVRAFFELLQKDQEDLHGQVSSPIAEMQARKQLTMVWSDHRYR